jgi:hypothetical protein
MPKTPRTTTLVLQKEKIAQTPAPNKPLANPKPEKMPIPPTAKEQDEPKANKAKPSAAYPSQFSHQPSIALPSISIPDRLDPLP